jgi:hypothetical protein
LVDNLRRLLQGERGSLLGEDLRDLLLGEAVFQGVLSPRREELF